MLKYETQLTLLDTSKSFKLYLHTLTKDIDFTVHWHENIEFLYVVEGKMEVISNQAVTTATAGQLVVINSNHLHKLLAKDDVKFYCLIVSQTFLYSLGFPLENIEFSFLIDSEETTQIFQNIVKEFDVQREHYMIQSTAHILSLMVRLFRCHQTKKQDRTALIFGQKIDAVKKILKYIQEHYLDSITLQDIADATGFNKYYISHIFKEFVGDSIICYINRLKCMHAKSLLVSGTYTVTEAAEICGLDNLSYFSQTYKKYMHTSPSQHKKHISVEQ